MNKLLRTSAMGAFAALGLTISTLGAQATPVAYASGSNSVVMGTGAGALDRADITNAYGKKDGKFYSLGLGGEAVFTFLPAVAFRSPGSVIEVTYGIRDKHKESMKLIGILAGVETYIGIVSNSMASAAFTFFGKFDSLKVVDTSDVVSGRDGYDIDSIAVTPATIPLPAGGMLLLGALGGIAALRRRKAV